MRQSRESRDRVSGIEFENSGASVTGKILILAVDLRGAEPENSSMTLESCAIVDQKTGSNRFETCRKQDRAYSRPEVKGLRLLRLA